MSSIRKVLVTGGSGRVGRYVIDELQKNFDVTNMDLISSDAQVEYIEGNVLDLSLLRTVTKDVDAVVHLAAIDFDWKAAPEKYIHVNTLGTWNVLQAAAESELEKVVLCSSISACGLSEMRPDWTPQYLQVDERHELRPVQAYSVSKQVMELMGLSFVRGTKLNVVCLRPLAVVLPETVQNYISFVDDPDTRWLYYYVGVQDVARGFHQALDVEDLRYGVFFLSADDTSRPEPTLEWYQDRIGRLPDIHNPRVFKQRPRASIFSNIHARELLGWEPTTDFLQIRETGIL